MSICRYTVIWTDAVGGIQTWADEVEDADIATLHGALGIAEQLFKRGALDVTITDEDRHDRIVAPMSGA